MTTMNTRALTARDRELIARLERRGADDPRYWDFRQVRARSGSHGLFQYPAMMVPELQGALLDDLIAVDPNVKSVYDPFTGSGTVLVESVTRELDFVGGDVNPMALLLSAVKAEPPRKTDGEHALHRALTLANAGTVDVQGLPVFFGRDKWFTERVLADLQRLRAGIKQVRSRRARRFLWVCLAETVRLSSNSRISTFKLHLYSEAVLSARKVDVLGTFEDVAERNLAGLFDYWTQVQTEQITLGAARLLQGPAQDTWADDLESPDVLMTSPPYGDNRTTVPYGQHSYLPLQWIDADDIPGGAKPDLLRTTASIDAVSLGGSNVGALNHRDRLTNESASLAAFLEQIETKPALVKKVLSFTADYFDTLRIVSGRVREDAYCFFTLGERRVGGKRYPLVAITEELLESLGHTSVHVFHRNLPIGRKRMAVTNSEGATMAMETVLITRRGDEPRGA